MSFIAPAICNSAPTSSVRLAMDSDYNRRRVCIFRKTRNVVSTRLQQSITKAKMEGDEWDVFGGHAGLKSFTGVSGFDVLFGWNRWLHEFS
jgi:hypothetical protein